jgi:hypothetical protein
MRDYRAYIIDIDGHRFLKANQFGSDYPDDATAMKAAEWLIDGHDVEVWECARLVARFDHKSRAVISADDQMKADLRSVASQSLVPAAEIGSEEQVLF